MHQLVRSTAVISMVLTLGVVLLPTPSHGQGGMSPLVPPQSNAFGKSFEEWNRLQNQYALQTGLGTGSPSDTVRGVRLLPGEFFDPAPVFNITLSPGTPFVAAPFWLFGERYDDPNVPDDDPVELAAFLQQIISEAQIKIVLDGKVLVEGSGADLEKFLFGPVYLDQPVVYAQPQPRGGNLNSVAALWVTGIGAVYRPLSTGEHTLVYSVESDFTGNFEVTYNITVSPK
jgi:hypothetical protein